MLTVYIENNSYMRLVLDADFGVEYERTVFVSSSLRSPDEQRLALYAAVRLMRQ